MLTIVNDLGKYNIDLQTLRIKYPSVYDEVLSYYNEFEHMRLRIESPEINWIEW